MIAPKIPKYINSRVPSVCRYNILLYSFFFKPIPWRFVHAAVIANTFRNKLKSTSIKQPRPYESPRHERKIQYQTNTLSIKKNSISILFFRFVSHSISLISWIRPDCSSAKLFLEIHSWRAVRIRGNVSTENAVQLLLENIAAFSRGTRLCRFNNQKYLINPTTYSTRTITIHSRLPWARRSPYQVLFYIPSHRAAASTFQDFRELYDPAIPFRNSTARSRSGRRGQWNGHKSFTTLPLRCWNS